MTAILKYKEHPSVLAVQNKYKDQFKFYFEEMNLGSIENEIHDLKINKTSHNSNVPTKTKKKNIDSFAEINGKAYTAQFNLSIFPHTLIEKIWPTFSECFKKWVFS